METISQIVAVPYLPLDFLNIHPKYQSIGFPIIVFEQEISQIGFFPKHIYSGYLSRKWVRLFIEHIKMEVGPGTPVL